MVYCPHFNREIEPGTCTLCKTRPESIKSRFRKGPPKKVIVAAFHGLCERCDTDIDEGDRIHYDDFDGWIHEDC